MHERLPFETLPFETWKIVMQPRTDMHDIVSLVATPPGAEWQRNAPANHAFGCFHPQSLDCDA
jgi:hypothetical protein